MNQLFDDTPYIDKSIVTAYDKRKWKKKFQEYCDSEEIREESSHTGLNACGYWYACEECEIDRKLPCSSALIKYLSSKNVNIDYKDTSKEYLDKLLRMEVSKMIRCRDCHYLLFQEGNGNPSRYYCKHPKICQERQCGAVLISRCDRHSEELKTKTSPRWCPLKEVRK